MTYIPAAATNAKVLVPLATMLAAGAVAIGSGATFTSQSVHTASVASGTLSQSNDHDGATLSILNIKPGDTKTGSLTITNTGSVDALASVAASAVTDTFSSALTISIDEVDQTGTAVNLYKGDFAGLEANPTLQLGALDAHKAVSVTYTVNLSHDASNSDQAKAAGATFTYATAQNDGNDKSTTSFTK